MAHLKKDEAQAAFLDALEQGLPVIRAAEDARVPRRTLYNWRETDREFADAWEAAYDRGSDLLEQEAQRRAVDGVTEPRMIGSGENAEVVQVRKYSDTLLIFLLKARRPLKYRDNVKHDHEHHGSVEIAIREAREQLGAELAAIAERRSKG